MKILKWLIYIILLVAIALAAYLYFNRDNKKQSIERPKPLVTVSSIKIEPYTPVIEAVGTAKSNESVIISVNVTEFVKKIHFKDGQKVSKGALLLTLGDEQEHAQMMQVQANYNEAKAQFERIKKLLKRNYSARSEHDLSEAKMKSTFAQLNEVKAKINDRVIKAPFSGILGFRQVSEGALLEPGDPIVTLDMIAPIKVDFTLSEHLLRKIRTGQKFTAISVAYDNQRFEGKISAIATRLDDLSRSVRVRGIIPNKDHKLKPGMLLKIKIPTTTQMAPVVPEQSILSYANKNFIYVVRDKTVNKINIKIIDRYQGYCIIKAKLPQGALLVVDGGFKLKPGMRVDTRHVDI